MLLLFTTLVIKRMTLATLGEKVNLIYVVEAPQYILMRIVWLSILGLLSNIVGTYAAVLVCEAGTNVFADVLKAF
ncbi:hypothetical protein ACFW35_02910 [Fictibacillus sp. NPDC058756]|uniref:hypothetical protein n=1 Tax=Fictibacillus sp. NPDC058756 TaxID=3346625 RepID=UPI00368F972B